MFKSKLNEITPYTPGRSIESIQKEYGLTGILNSHPTKTPWAQLLIMQMYPAKLNYTQTTTHTHLSVNLQAI